MSIEGVWRQMIRELPTRVLASILALLGAVVICTASPGILLHPLAVVFVQVASFSAVSLAYWGHRRFRRRVSSRARPPLEPAADAPEQEFPWEGSSAEEVEQRAAMWLALLDLHGSPEEWKAFDKWLSANPRHRAAYLRLAVAWRYSDGLKRLAPPGDEVDPDLLAPRERSEVLKGRKIVLADGSTLRVRSRSDVRVLEWGTTRRLSMSFGEVIFHVKQSAAATFELSLRGEATVRVVGTVFAVSAPEASDEIAVLVAEGQVAVQRRVLFEGTAAESVAVSSGQKALLTGRRIRVRDMTSGDIFRKFGLQYISLLNWRG